MCRSFALAALVLAAWGCDAREPVGPDPVPVPRLVAMVTYQVQGTYAACRITYTTPLQGIVTLGEVALPWRREVRVAVDEQTGPFDAVVLATCTDPGKQGKSTAMLFVDGEMKRRDAATGPGATSEASFRVGEDA